MNNDKKYIVRIIRTVIENVKNVEFGEITYLNYGSVSNVGALQKTDIVGVYGQNGSGKTALVETMDILQYVLRGLTIPYDVYGGILSTEKESVITTEFFVMADEVKYKVEYIFTIKSNDKQKRIEICNEKLVYYVRKKGWAGKRDLSLENPFYSVNDLLATRELKIQSAHENKLCREMPFLASLQNLGAACAKSCSSIFFDPSLVQRVQQDVAGEEQSIFRDIILALKKFGTVDLNVVTVNQLGMINCNLFIPLNMHEDLPSVVRQGCTNIKITEPTRIPLCEFEIVKRVIDSINIVLKALVPNLQIELQKTDEDIDVDNLKYVTIGLLSVRNGKKFSLKHESEGIKRIISILNNLISVYNNPAICLVVDELDSGIFEYLLGELLGFMKEGMQGQLIFTSHNLRVLEKLDVQSIVCSTANPNNRFIRMTGISTNHNRRDFYIRSLIIGGQKEELYDGNDLSSMGYAFRKAARIAPTEGMGV